MTKEIKLSNEKTFDKIKVMGNKLRFKILELTQDEELSISEISKELKLAYTKCADYITMLQKEGLIEKRKAGKEVYVKSVISLEELF